LLPASLFPNGKKIYLLWGMFTTVLYILFVVSVTIQCGYALYFFSRIFRLPAATVFSAPQQQPVSIIICAKNEAHNLRQNLPAILSQRYMNEAGKSLYEVIVVNDASTDDTPSVLQELEQQYDNLWDVSIFPDDKRTFQGKKNALSKGLALAGYNWLLLTDADCKPSSDMWLQNMVAPLGRGKAIVAGYGGYYAAKGLLNAFIRWETVHTFLQYSTYALAGHPYMAVGRNLACTREALLKAQGSAVWNALPSGDDDLLVNIVANKHNVAIVCNENAFTYSAAKANWAEWIKQKQRHLSTGKYYKQSAKALLGIYGITHTIMWLLFFILLFFAGRQRVILLMAARLLVYWVLFAITAFRLKEKKSAYLFPLFDFGWMIYNFAFAPYIIWKNKKQWK
jgi:cellulose synthase/poly-beta-1,6-N-acetylglucosamine synthase-like glycosyltransferase